MADVKHSEKGETFVNETNENTYDREDDLFSQSHEVSSSNMQSPQMSPSRQKSTDKSQGEMEEMNSCTPI